MKKSKRNKSEDVDSTLEVPVELSPLLLLQAEVEADKSEEQRLSEELDLEISEKKRKSRKGAATIVGITSIVFGLITIIFSIFSPFETSAVINPVSDAKIHVDITVVSSQFSAATSSSVCLGSGQLVGISTSILAVTQKSSSLSLTSTLGKGSLTQSGSCLYSVALTPPSGFSGGKISGRITFPFGAAPSTTFDLGSQLPYAHFPITINLS